MLVPLSFEFHTSRAEALFPAEREVALLLAVGYDEHRIAQIRGRSTNTVGRQVDEIRAKMGVTGVHQFVSGVWREGEESAESFGADTETPEIQHIKTLSQEGFTSQQLSVLAITATGRGTTELAEEMGYSLSHTKRLLHSAYDVVSDGFLDPETLRTQQFGTIAAHIIGAVQFVYGQE